MEESDRHSSFVEFNSKLDVLAEEISEFCRSEQKFILYVRKQKEDELAVPEEQLLSRHEQKNTIVGQIISCLKQ